MRTTPGTGAYSMASPSHVRRCERASSLLVQPSPSSRPFWARCITSATQSPEMPLAVPPMVAPALAWAHTTKGACSKEAPAQRRPQSFQPASWWRNAVFFLTLP